MVSIKLSNILIIKAIASLVLILLMASSVSLIIVSAIVTTEGVDAKTDNITATCQVNFEFESDNEFLNINSVTCKSVSKVIFSYPQNILNDSQCFSNIRNYDIEDVAATSRSLEHDYDYMDSNQTSQPSTTDILPVGFGTLENLIFVVTMVLLCLALAVLVLCCRKPRRKASKALPEKIILYSTKKKLQRENQTERTL